MTSEDVLRKSIFRSHQVEEFIIGNIQVLEAQLNDVKILELQKCIS
jgi:hypothetical protein